MQRYTAISILQGTIKQLEEKHMKQLDICNKWVVTQTTHVHTPIKEDDGKPDLQKIIYAWTTIIPA